MTFAVAAGYGIAICIATAALIRLSSMARLPVVVRSSGRRMPEGRAAPSEPDFSVGRYIR